MQRVCKEGCKVGCRLPHGRRARTKASSTSRAKSESPFFVKGASREGRYGVGSLLVIGHRVIVIATDDEDELSVGGMQCHGVFDPNQMIILVDSRAPRHFRAATLQHELGHAVLYALGLSRRLATEAEEDIVDLFAPALLGTVGSAAHASDELMRFLASAEPKRRARG